MTKPILVLMLKYPSLANLASAKAAIPESIKQDYHVLVLSGEETKAEVFYEKDHSPLSQEKLEELLSLCSA